MKNVLIIGGSGYLGTVITKNLLNQKFNVKIIDNFMYGDCFIKDLPDNFKIIKKKIKDASEINIDDLENIDVCIFLSALSNNPIDNLNPKKAYDETKDYTLAVAKLCKKKKYQIYISFKLLCLWKKWFRICKWREWGQSPHFLLNKQIRDRNRTFKIIR